MTTNLSVSKKLDWRGVKKLCPEGFVYLNSSELSSLRANSVPVKVLDFFNLES